MKSLRIVFMILFCFFCCPLLNGVVLSPEPTREELDFRELPGYSSAGEQIISIEDTVAYRAGSDPLDIFSTFIFVLAVIHTLFARRIQEFSRHLERKNGKTFASEFFHFFGEVEIIFGIWVIPLLFAITYTHDWRTALTYLNTRNYTEVMVIVVIMAITATHPIMVLAEKCLKWLACLGKGTTTAWWFTLMTVGPLFGSFITEPGAITITALLLSKFFYSKHPSKELSYATLGLLFTNISVGGLLTAYAAPPILMVTEKWHWDTLYVMKHFGWKAVLGIIIANTTCYYYYRKEFAALDKKEKASPHHEEEVHHADTPLWISLAHIVFLFFIVLHLHEPVIAVGAFLVFLGFHEATRKYQRPLNMRSPLLVGFFFAGLIIHGGLQEWWIAPMLSNVTQITALLIGITLSPFTDNAAITYLATLVPDFSDILKYMLVVGAVSVGGTTIIANAPNPAGQQILSRHFSGGISGKRLFLGALFPTCIMLIVFLLFRGTIKPWW